MHEEELRRMSSVAHEAARKMGLQDAECEDVAQITMLQLHEARLENKVIDIVEAWVRKVARRKVFDVYRQRRRGAAIAGPAVLDRMPGGEAQASHPCALVAHCLAAYLRAPKTTARVLSSWDESRQSPGDKEADRRFRAAKSDLGMPVGSLRCGDDAAAFRDWARGEANLLSLEDLPRFGSLLGRLLSVDPRGLEFALAAAQNEAVEAALRMEAADLSGDFQEAVKLAGRLPSLAGPGDEALALTDAGRIFANAAQETGRRDSQEADRLLLEAEKLLVKAEALLKKTRRGRAELTFQLLYNHQIVAQRRKAFAGAKRLLKRLEGLNLNNSRRGSVRLQSAETLLQRYQSGKQCPKLLHEASRSLDEAAGLLGTEHLNRRVAHAGLCRARVLREMHANPEEVLKLAEETRGQYRLFGCMRYVREVAEEFGLPSED